MELAGLPGFGTFGAQGGHEVGMGNVGITDKTLGVRARLGRAPVSWNYSSSAINTQSENWDGGLGK